MENEFKNIFHSLDVWHKSKNSRKVITKVCNQTNVPVDMSMTYCYFLSHPYNFCTKSLPLAGDFVFTPVCLSVCLLMRNQFLRNFLKRIFIGVRERGGGRLGVGIHFQLGMI